MNALLLLGAVLGTLLYSPNSHAYVWMIRHGYGECAACHTDPSGGEGLTQMGRVQSELLLSQAWSSRPELTSNAKTLSSLDEPDWLRLGGSIRGMSILDLPHGGAPADLTAFPMQLDVYSSVSIGQFRAGASVGYADVPLASPHLRAAQVFQKESGPNMISRSHWLGWAPSDGWLLRAGRLNLPYGLRISEHVQWVRDATKTDRESDQQHGLALAHSYARWRWELMGVLGNFQIQPDAVRERGYAGYLEYRVLGELAVGLQSEVLHSKESIQFGRTEPTTRQAHGLTLRYAPTTSVVLLAEGSMLAATDRNLGHVALLTADYEPVQGLHLALSEEMLDSGNPKGQAPLVGAGKTTTGSWLTLHWFPVAHWDLQVDFVSRYSTTPTVQAQLHYYL
ncbi:MAG TPA: hypothetical protein VHM70_00550 [Polyangiaceae bacterium]|nr:hypothetical protein [Polyangiaceae bacterium]